MKTECSECNGYGYVIVGGMRGGVNGEYVIGPDTEECDQCEGEGEIDVPETDDEE